MEQFSHLMEPQGVKCVLFADQSSSENKRLRVFPTASHHLILEVKTFYQKENKHRRLGLLEWKWRSTFLGYENKELEEKMWQFLVELLLMRGKKGELKNWNMFEKVSEENFPGEKSKRGGRGWDRLLDSRAAWRRYGGGIEKWQLLANDIIWSWIDIFWLILYVYILPEQKYETSGTSDHLVWHSHSRVVYVFLKLVLVYLNKMPRSKQDLPRTDLCATYGSHFNQYSWDGTSVSPNRFTQGASFKKT